MAVLKDLIVHGSSRFLNKSYFNTINAKSIGADQGIFKKLIATSLEAEEATFDNLTADNAIVTGLLDVQGELHTNAWTNANIANIGGSFYISPTVEPTDGTTTISITRNSATSWTVSATGTFATNFIKSGTATSGVAWPANSLVLITGDVVVGNMVYPLGTLKGTLSAQVTATAATTSKTITINGVTDAQNNNAPSVLQELYSVNNNTNISDAPFKKGKISLYKLGSNPIGILMTSMGTNSNSLIDIFGGTGTTPNVRIGHLGALSSYTDSAGNTRQPTGWGIYTDNGFFKGVVVADSGSIGHFTIDANAIYSGEHSAYNTSNKNGIFIGRPNSSSSDYYVSGGPGALWYLKSDGSAKIGQMTLSTAGVLALGSISLNASGTASIGPWTVNSTSIYKGNATYGTSGSGNMYFGNNGLSISNTFKVSSDGALTAKSADIEGKITVTSGFIGSYKIDSQYLQATDETTGMSIKDDSYTKDWAFWAGGTTKETAKFRVTHDGDLYAQSLFVNIGGRNLLKGTKDPVISSTDSQYTWIVQSGGNGIGTIETVTDSPIPSVSRSFRITGNTSGNKDFVQNTDEFQKNWGGQWTFSAYVRGIGGNATVLIRSWNNTDNNSAFTYTKTVGTSWEKVIVRIPIDVSWNSSASASDTLDIRFGMTGAGAIEYIAPKLEQGIVATDWSPAPEDSITSWKINANDIKNESTSKCTLSVSNDVVTVTRLDSTNVFGCYYDLPCKPNKYYSVSMRVTAGGTGFDFYFGGDYGSGSVWSGMGVAFQRQANGIRRATIYKPTSSTQTYIRIYIGSRTQNSTISFRDLTVYEGDDLMMVDKDVVDAAADAAKTATDYLTFTSSAGLDIKSSSYNSKVNIKSDGVRIYDQNGKERNLIDSNGVKIKDASGNVVASLATDLVIGREYTNLYNVKVDADSGVLIRKNTTNLSKFDGSGVYFYDGSGTAAANITAQFQSSGAVIGKSNTYHTAIDSNGMHIYDGSSTPVEVAKFTSSSAVIGKTSSAQITLNSSTMQLSDKDGNVFFKAYNADGDNGYVTNYFAGDGEKKTFTLQYTAVSSTYVVTVNGETASPTKTNSDFTFTNPPEDGAAIVAQYYAAWGAVSYDLGIRKSNTVTGSYSLIQGKDLVASGIYSFATGENCEANGPSSLAGGYYCKAAGYSIAYGNYSEATGGYSVALGHHSIASGLQSYAMGNVAIAKAKGSAAIGNLTTAASRDQTVVGSANVEDTEGKYVFIVGNGKYPNYTRSNALTVDWDGGLQCGNIKCGVFQVDNCNAYAMRNITITFSKPFKTGELPCVVAMFAGGAGSYTFGNVQLSVSERSNTSFTIRIYNATNTAISPYVHWIATTSGQQ